MQFELNQFVSNDNLLGSSLNMGGIGSQNVKILLNGIPVMGRENGNIDMGQMNMATVKRVEMIQGPMSVMYGSNALGGVVNIITQAPTKKWSANIRSYNETIQRHNLTTGIGLQYKKTPIAMEWFTKFLSGMDTKIRHR
jgi:outer membrane receptor for ferrienterochelin and colicins